MGRSILIKSSSRDLIDYALARTRKGGIGVPLPPVVLGGGPAGNTLVPVIDGAAAVMLQLPPLVVPIGSTIQFAGFAIVRNNVANGKSFSVSVEIAGNPGTAVTGSVMSFAAGNASGTAAPISGAFLTTTASTTFTINVVCTQPFALLGDLSVDGGNIYASAAQIR